MIFVVRIWSHMLRLGDNDDSAIIGITLDCGNGGSRAVGKEQDKEMQSKLGWCKIQSLFPPPVFTKKIFL